MLTVVFVDRADMSPILRTAALPRTGRWSLSTPIADAAARAGSKEGSWYDHISVGCAARSMPAVKLSGPLRRSESRDDGGQAARRRPLIQGAFARGRGRRRGSHPTTWTDGLPATIHAAERTHRRAPRDR